MTASAQQASIEQQIEQLYNARQYPQAMALIDQNLQTYPVSGWLHYLRGNILVATGQAPAAVREYQQAIGLQPGPTVEAYCERALATITGASLSTQVVNTPQAASGVLQSQANQEALMVQTQNQLTGSQLVNDAANFQQRHAAKTANIAARMASSGSYDADGNWYPAYSSSDYARMEARRKAVEDRAIYNAARDNADLQTAAQEKAAAAVSAAEGLQSQIGTQVGPGEAAVNPVGTSLFVRNYSVAEPATQPAFKLP